MGNNKIFLVLNQFHYIGFFFLLCLIVSFFFFRQYYKYVVIFALFAGVFDIACFSGSNFVVTLGGKNSHLSLQPLSLFVATVFFFINFKRISLWVKEKSEPISTVIPREEKNAFIEKYEHLTDQELYSIRGDKRYIPAARVAAEHIISLRLARRNGGNAQN